MHHKTKSRHESQNSDDETADYQNILASSLNALSNIHHNDSIKTPTESRIYAIKKLLEGSILKPMVDFDRLDTEIATNTVLEKKILNLKDLANSMNIKLYYLKSGSTGHTFKAVSKQNKDVTFAVKVCAYPKDDYGGIHNVCRPENAELNMLKLLSYFVINKRTPHFVLPIGTFNTTINYFVNIPAKIIDLDDEKNEMYRKFISRYHEGKFENYVSILISEWCDGGDLLDFIRKNYQNMSLKEWRIIMFHIFYTLAKVQEKFPSFRHNDLKANNILVQYTNVDNIVSDNIYCYQIGNVKFFIPNINLQIKIWDFDFACIDGIIENNKVNSEWAKGMNITKTKNRYYDIHYFISTLITPRFFKQFYTGGVPEEIIQFAHRVVPPKYQYGGEFVNKRGRIQINEEYTTPIKVITEDPLFEKYRFLN